MTKDNSTGKNKEFYDLGKAMFDRIQVLPEHQAMIQRGVDRTTPPAGDIRALKHRIHELEGELMGYKKIVADQDATLERQTARIVGLQDEIRNLTGEEE
jgi:hypothetical protein